MSFKLKVKKGVKVDFTGLPLDNPFDISNYEKPKKKQRRCLNIKFRQVLPKLRQRCEALLKTIGKWKD